MSSSDDDAKYSPQRRRSSTPDTPRKRRRLGSLTLDVAGLRKHDLLRRREVEANYNDDYRVFFNQEVIQAASRFEVSETALHYTKQVGSSIWSGEEQATFFASLERLGKDDLPGIAGAIGTKGEVEARDFLLLLQDAAAKQGDAKVTLRDIPAAIEVGHACDQKLEDAGDALAWYQETFEAAQEQERYGEYWLITPSIAEEIEDAINGNNVAPTPSRPASASGEREPSRYGKGVAGACELCKKRRIKCDRKVPCTHCTKRNADCVYLKNPPTSAQLNPLDRTENLETSTGGTAVHPIFQAIPEASLLQPEVMLTLSREIFMNRSASIPSPWPHWSNYVSEIAAEPSMYRTAFNDFHRLVVSVTKRLVQTAIVQATSRLRSQRFRVEKGTQPFVKTRDIHSAIDVLGLKRNGSERWRGVPRRCGLRVTASNATPQGRRTRDVPWSEVERIMAPATSPNERVESSAEPENFKSRAARSGTPLPIHNLTLSDADDDEDEIQQEDEIEDDSDISEHFTDTERMPSTHRVRQPRDPIGRYATVPPDEEANEHLQYLVDIEAFDQEASRQEENVLWEMLGTEAKPKDDATNAGDNLKDLGMDADEKVTTLTTNWRQLFKYCAPWEEYQTPVSIAELIANQKPPSPMPTGYARAHSTEVPHDDASDASSTLQTKGQRQKSAGEVNLHARGTNAYAALQRAGLGNLSRSSGDSSSDRESSVPEEDVPTQSIEAEQGAVDIGDDSDAMDWS